jgi:hypothetical protein
MFGLKAQLAHACRITVGSIVAWPLTLVIGYWVATEGSLVTGQKTADAEAIAYLSLFKIWTLKWSRIVLLNPEELLLEVWICLKPKFFTFPARPRLKSILLKTDFLGMRVPIELLLALPLL